MIIVKPMSGQTNIKATGLYQWDQLKTLQFEEEYPNGTEVHFAIKGETVALVYLLENGAVRIPSVLLQRALPIMAWVHVGEATVLEIEMPVTPRAMPSDYVGIKDVGQHSIEYRTIQLEQWQVEAIKQMTDRYTKAETDKKLKLKADANRVHTKLEVSTLLNEKVNLEEWDAWRENFVAMFNTEVQDNVRDRVQELYDSGKLEELTADVIDAVQDQIDEISDDVVGLEINTNKMVGRLRALLEESTANLEVLGVSDNQSFQNVLDLYPRLNIPNKTYEINSLKYTDELTIKGNNKYKSILKHSPNAIEPMFSRKDSVRGKITIENITFDGNKENQTNRLDTLYLIAEEVNIINCRFINTIKNAVFINATKLVRILNCSFEDMAEHSGVPGETTKAIYIEGDGCEAIIENNYFETPTPSVEGRAAGGIYVSGTLPSTIIKNNIFKGIGQYATNNYIGNIDLYTNGNKSIVTGNKFYNYRFVPLKLQNCGDLICSDNIVDGANNEQAGQALAYQPAERGSTPAKYNAIIKNNILKNTLTGAGIIINGQSTTYTKNLEVSGNIIEDVERGINIRYVDGNTIVSDNIITGHIGRGIEFEDVSSRFTVKHNTIDGGYDGIFARIGVANASFLIDGNEVKNNSNLGLSVRDFDEVIMTSNKLNGVTSIDMARGNRAVLAFNTRTATNGIAPLTITSYHETGNSWNDEPDTP